MKTLTLISALVVLISVASAAPQWPYRDNMESYYYGYQNDKPSKSFYRAADVIEDDDENEEPQITKFRQDLKVGQSSQNKEQSDVVLQQGTSAGQPIQVIETGSVKPVPQNVPQNKPVQAVNQPQNNKQGNQPFVQGGQQQQPPAFPPAPGARPPNSGARPPNAGGPGGDDDDDEEEEDSDEEEAGDDEGQNDDDDESDEEEDDEDDRRRNEPVVIQEQNINSTSTVLPESNEDDSMEKKNVTMKTEKPKTSSGSDKKKKPSNKQQQGQGQRQHEQTIEALVPGYITDQGEVLVPFDTVSGNINRPGDIAIIPDPNYKPSTLVGSGGVRQVKKVKKPSKGTPPVVVVPKKELPATRAVPQFFRADNEKFYYSSAPPPGSIFTFDDDSENVPAVSPKLRQDDQSSEEEEEEDEENDDTSDESAEEEEDIIEAPPRPPLRFVKATGPSGEDDEAESLGLRPGTPIQSRSGYFDENYVSFPSSRSPTVFAVQIPYNPEYFAQQQYYGRRPQYNRPQYNRPQYRPQYNRPQYIQQYGQYRPEYSSSEYRPQYNRPQAQYNRPQYNEYYRPSYNRPGQNQYNGQRPTNAVYYYRPESNKQTKVIPVANFDVSLEHDEESGEVKPVLSPYYYKDVKLTKKNRPVVVRSKPQQRPVRPSGGGRPQQQHQLLAVYNNGENYSFTPVIRQRSSSRLNQARMAKQLKDKKKVKASKKEVVEDPLNLLKKVNNKSNKKQ